MDATAAPQVPQPSGAKIHAIALPAAASRRSIQLIFREHLEGTVHKAEVRGEPYEDGGEQDDGARRFLMKEQAAFPHRPQDIADGRPVVCRKFHNKRRRFATATNIFVFFSMMPETMTRRAFPRKSAEVRDPGRVAEDRAGNHRDERNLGPAGDKGRRHDRHTTVALIFNGTGSHDARDTAARADQHRDRRTCRTGRTSGRYGQVRMRYAPYSRSLRGRPQHQHRERRPEHLRHKAEDRADAGHDPGTDHPLSQSAARPLFPGRFPQGPGCPAPTRHRWRYPARRTLPCNPCPDTAQRHFPNPSSWCLELPSL